VEQFNRMSSSGLTKTADLLRGVDAQLQLALRLAATPRPD
jgi:hypothetical protein